MHFDTQRRGVQPMQFLEYPDMQGAEPLAFVGLQACLWEDEWGLPRVASGSRAGVWTPLL